MQPSVQYWPYYHTVPHRKNIHKNDNNVSLVIFGKTDWKFARIDWSLKINPRLPKKVLQLIVKPFFPTVLMQEFFYYPTLGVGVG